MAESFGVGDIALVCDKTNGNPELPGVVVGYVVRNREGEFIVCFEDELGLATKEEIESSGIVSHRERLLEDSEEAFNGLLMTELAGKLSPPETTE